MAKKEAIITLPNEHLREKSQRVGIINDEIVKIIEDMKSATLDWEASRKHEAGIALAAIQLDRPYRIIIVRNDIENRDDHSFSVFINPQITKLEGEIVEDFEGCLSVQDVYGKVPRYSKVRVRAINEQGQEIRIKTEGFLARTFQHEIDHLKGVIFIDHIRGKDAFYQLKSNGELTKLDHEKVDKSDILWN